LARGCRAVVEPVSLGALGGVALTEGIKFLYGQATELLKRRRDRAERRGAEAMTVPVESAAVLDAPMAPTRVDLDVVAGNEGRLRALRRELGDYADGLADANPSDRQLLAQVAALRGLLELAYGQYLTFRDEQRPPTGSPLPTEARDAVERYVATVTAIGPGAVAIGRDNTGSITTSPPSRGSAFRDSRGSND
jgi:hypothetical protein